MWRKAAILTLCLLLAGCATCPGWYDKTKGTGASYEDAEGSYYLGPDYASGTYYKIRGGSPTPTPILSVLQ